MGSPFELPSELNIYCAIQTRDDLLAWFTAQTASSTAGVLEISARNVSEVDGAGLQLLAALTNAGRPWRLTDASGAFINACRTLGFSEWTEDLEKATEKGSS